MTIDVEDPTWTARLSQSLLKAGREAALRGDSVPISVTVAIPYVDPLSVFERAAGEDRAFWEQPSEALSMAAVGAAQQFTARGSDRFAEIDADWQRLIQSTIIEAPEGAPAGPIALGGFSFDQKRESSSRWQAFGDALLTLPHYLVVSKHGQSWLTVNEIGGLGSDDGAHAERRAAELGRLLIQQPAAQGEPVPVVGVEDELDADQWRLAAGAAIREISSGSIRKIVLAREAHASASARLDPAAILRRLRPDYHTSTLFAFARGDACFLGATPERLVRVDGTVVRADCLAGTIRCGASDDEAEALGRTLLADPKERHEHALVVEALRDVLLPRCSELVIPDAPVLLATKAVQHLHTPVEGTLKDGGNILDIVASLHPTPAAGGLPRDAALRLIREYEPFDRGWYAGPVGWVDGNGGGDFAVAIRSMLLTDDRATLFAGCGIVAGSEPEREYQESRLKMRPMLWALNAHQT